MVKFIKAQILILLLLGLSTATSAQDATKAHKDSLNSVINKYYELNLKVFQANSKAEDINAIFDLFTDDFTYVHPKYGGTYTREDLYNGYLQNQKNGGYDGSIIDFKIINKIVGLNAVVVEKIFVNKNEEENQEDKSEMTLFEFRNGKIFRVFEYW
ncbi:ketosteroid isomerase-like protein [Saonia flava]|uniref:Ketosteroid isomerase-like protein n=1 Tax=Saonia flava TaxID=523696 RepID=A0A846R4I1_9FLAO|nr:nuclear transport factor 2 family protein [Saonia flava]NJB71709.1 ketosteroid isomerase-like protein [Saonia flava]